MGLDIYHLCANAERRGSPFVLSEADAGKEDMRTKFAWCLQEVDFPITDWSATLAPHGFEAAQYDHTFSMPVRKNRSDPHNRIDGFRRRINADPTLPELLFVTNSDEKIEPRILRGWGPHAVLLKAEYVSGTLRETVVYGEEIGYQRKSVMPAFYNEFQPSELVVEIERVRCIHGLTFEDGRRAFKENFLDTWDERTSFVCVSW